jgi:hypothetical protein
MIHVAAVLLHGSAGEILFAEYLYRVGLHLLAVAVVAIVVHWWAGLIGRTSAKSGVEENGKENEL